MSLRKALDALSDDRETASAVRLVIAFFAAHPNEPVEPVRVSRATGVPVARVEHVMRTLSDAFVLDCGGSDKATCTFAPTTVLTLEVRRFLRAKSNVDSRLQAGTQRFRDQYGR
jgi:hypothetical protein